jgi:peptidoglycan/LPS O-acetylase OafA/YrhL
MLESKSVALTQKQTSYLPRLDILRGIAALLIFLLHCFYEVFHSYNSPWKGLFPDFFANGIGFLVLSPLTFAWVGVPFFFVLSGFVIHLATLKAGEFRLTRFYWKRFWRIYPAYLLAVIVFSIKNHQLGDFWQVLSHLLLIHNFSSDRNIFFGITPVFWTIAVEMQFYLLYPLFLLLRHKLGVSKVLLITLMLSLTLKLIILTLYGWSDGLEHLWRSVPVLWFDWILGAYLAEQYFQQKRVFSLTNRQFCLTVSLFVLTVFFRPLGQIISFSFASIIAAVIIERCVWSNKPLSPLEMKLLPLGLCSYSFYLWHMPIMQKIYNLSHRLHLPQEAWFMMTFGVTISFAIIFPLSWLLYQTVERRSRSFGQRLLHKSGLG